jgi:ppGpp synthetase/RelA/SpoT-type nucleotidyltranferase
VDTTFSNSQIDRLGDRLRNQEYGEAELRLLDEYRRTFGSAYDQVVGTIQRITGIPISGRPAKSTTSIIEKLNRESLRLSQMQDIAGCRAVVNDIAEQNHVVAAIATAFVGISVMDRRLKPSHGYRAVHLIVRDQGKAVEVQIRTALQHVWAEMCEKCADIFDPSVKYGGGPQPLRSTLDRAAALIHVIENLKASFARAGATDGREAAIVRDARQGYVTKLQSIVKELSESKPELLP